MSLISFIFKKKNYAVWSGKKTHTLLKKNRLLDSVVAEPSQLFLTSFLPNIMLEETRK